MSNLNERRILICAPLGKDAELACHVLEAAGLDCCVCHDLAQLLVELSNGVGTILTVEEALANSASEQLNHYLAQQPTWSDLPILVLTKSGGNSPWIEGAYERFGNLTLLERPVRAPTLVSAARSALRARLRQYEIRLSDERKDEFLAMLAHELRNPLAPISAAARLLGLIANHPEKVNQTSEIIGRQVAHMTNLIDDLLDVARVTRGLIKLDKEPLDIRQLVSEAVEQVAPQISLRHQHLSLRLALESAPVLGDRKRLIQVFANLLNNASKYTPENGNIEIKLQVHAAEITLEVSDNGVGIAPEMVSQVFELFAQAERTSDRSQGGLGLGLALVKSLVLSHGGSVHAFSQGPGLGSKFTVKLPRLNLPERADPDPTKNVPDPEEAFHRLRLMIVDDNVDAADALAMFLDATGHDVYVEYGAQQAIERARAISPQICILDIGLPDMDGNQLATHFRTMPETAGAKLIAVTGYSHDTDRKKSIAAGFDYHFVKPVDMEKLQALLTEMY